MNESYRDWLDANRAAMRKDLIELCEINSGSLNLSGLHSVAQWLEDWFQIPSTSFRKIHLKPRQMVHDDGTLSDVETGPLLRWDYEPESTRRVLLAIHYDTVFGPESPFQSCTQLDDDKLRGPGTADAKGGIIVLRNAVQAAIRSGVLGDLGLTVVLNPDEELGSPHSSTYFQQIASDFEFGLLFEPCLPSGEMVSQRKGSGNFDIVVRGQSAHAGRHFDEGRNAIVLLSQVLLQLDQLNVDDPAITVNVGSVHGGGPVNIVPDLAIGRVNVRMTSADKITWFNAQLQKIIDQADQRDGFSIELFGGITSPPKPCSPAVEALMRSYDAASCELTGQPVRWRATGGVCDGNKLAAAGLPNLDTLGPKGDGLHSMQEWVSTSSLSTKAHLTVRMLEKAARGEVSLDKQNA